MTILLAKVWTCDFCPATVTQDGERGASLLPVPPEGWFLVDVVRLVPKHAVKSSSGEVTKVGDTREVVRRILCYACGSRLESLAKDRLETRT